MRLNLSRLERLEQAHGVYDLPVRTEFASIYAATKDDFDSDAMAVEIFERQGCAFKARLRCERVLVGV